jgi:hypothetical protein
MAKHGVARRKFLTGAAVGAGAVAGVGLVPEAVAQDHGKQKEAPAHSHANEVAQRAFFNQDDSAIMAARPPINSPSAPGTR